jgi:type II secretory pathway component PulF
MKSLIPTQIRVLQEIIYLLESGKSVRESILILIDQFDRDQFIDVMQLWMKQKEVGLNDVNISGLTSSSINRKIFSLLDRGLNGESILRYLKTLELESREQVQIERDKSLAKLPIKLLVPLILLIFPAYLIVLLVPILSEFSFLLK